MIQIVLLLSVLGILLPASSIFAQPVSPLTLNQTRLDVGIVNRGETAATVQYRFTGKSIFAPVRVLAPLGVEVRTTKNGEWRKSIVFEASRQGAIDTTVFVRLDSRTELLVQSGIRHFIGETEANVRLDVLGIVREKPVIRNTADALEYAGHGLPVISGNITRLGTILIGYGDSYSAPYISTNDGESWTHFTMPGNRRQFVFMAQRAVNMPLEQSLYTFSQSKKNTSSVGLFRSDDNGKTWKEIASNVPNILYDSRSVWTQGTTWLAIAYNGILYRSTDNGVLWRRVNDTMLEDKQINNFIRPLDGNILLNVFSSSENYLLRSLDTGRTWQQFSILPRGDGVNYYDIFSNGRICLLRTGTQMYRLRENASTWDSLPRQNRTIFAFDGYFLAIDNDSTALYRSTDGAEWKQLAKLPYNWERGDNFFANILSYGATIHTVAGSNYTFLRSQDTGKTWHLALSGLRSPTTLTSLTKINSALWIPQSPYRLSAKTSFWEFDRQGYSYSQYWQNGLNGLFLGDIVLSGQLGGILRSINRGLSATLITQGFVPNANISALYHTNGMVFASGINGIYRSQDSGATWQNISKGLAANASIRGMTSLGLTIFAFDDNNGIYRSTSYGDSWELIGIPETRPYYSNKFQGVYGLFASATRLFMTSGGNPYQSGGNIYQSGDNGNTWQLLLQSDSATSYRAVAYRSPWLYVTTSEGLYRLALPPEPELAIYPPSIRFRTAANNPTMPVQTISVVNEGTVTGDIRSIVISPPNDFEVLSSPSSLIAPGDSAKLALRLRSKRPGTTSATATFFIGNPLNTVTSTLACTITSEVSADASFDQSSINTASQVAMGEVLPLPAQNEATLYYTLLDDTAVTLDIADMAGRIVIKIAEGTKPKGTHRVIVDTSPLANGVYIVMLRSRFGLIHRWLVVSK